MECEDRTHIKQGRAPRFSITRSLTDLLTSRCLSQRFKSPPLSPSREPRLRSVTTTPSSSQTSSGLANVSSRCTALACAILVRRLATSSFSIPNQFPLPDLHVKNDDWPISGVTFVPTLSSAISMC